KKGIWANTVGRITDGFSKFQDWLEVRYETVLHFTLRRPFVVLGVSFIIFISSFAALTLVPKTFLPAQDAGEFQVKLDLPPGTSLTEMNEVTMKVDEIIRKNTEVEVSAATVGNVDGESSVSSIYVRLVGAKQRKMNT